MKKRLQTALTILGVIVGVFVMNGGVAFASKINFSVSPTINEGAFQDVHLSLDAPIICPVMSPNPCQVSLTFNSTDPHVSASPMIVWNYTDWAQPRTLTINTSSDGIYTGNKTVNLTATALSDSVYYNNFLVTIPVTVVDQDPAPPPPAITDKDVSVTTGQSIEVDVLTGVSGNPDASTLSIVSGPSHGTAVDPPNTITYTPNPGYIGPDSLTYQVCSSLSNLICSTAVLTFSVLGAATTANPTIGTPDTGFRQDVADVGQAAMLLAIAVILLVGAYLAGSIVIKRHST